MTGDLCGRADGLAADDGETTAIIMSLRQKLKAQTEEVMSLQSKLSSLVNEHKAEVCALTPSPNMRSTI